MNQYIIRNQKAYYGFNHYLYTPLQLNYYFGKFSTGLVPAIISSYSLFYTKISYNLNSDYICNTNTLSSCSSSNLKMLNSSNWKLLIILSSKFQIDLSQIFNYNIKFSKNYTSPSSLKLNLTVVAYNTTFPDILDGN